MNDKPTFKHISEIFDEACKLRQLYPARVIQALELMEQARVRITQTDNQEGAVWRLIDAAGLLMQEYYDTQEKATGRFSIKTTSGYLNQLGVK